ncbi:MAG: signal peptidase I [Acutalibacteraceae bacterium]
MVIRKAFTVLKRVLSVLLLAVFTLMLICNIYSIISRRFFNKLQPTVFGFSCAVVISGSMSGTIEVNDLVVIRSADEYREGNIITFKEGSSLVTHRIVGEKDGGFITKGDANNAEDSEAVQRDDIVGRVVLVIPKIGAALEALKSPLGMTCTVFAFILIIMLPSRKQPEGQELQNGSRNG